MPSRYEPDPVERMATVAVAYHIAQLDERVSVPDGLQAQAAEVLEPRLVEEVQRVVVGVALVVDEFERAGHHEARALLYAAGQMRVGHGVAVDVVEPQARRVAHIDSRLPGVAPGCDVVARKPFGSAEQLHNQRGALCSLRLILF